MAASQPALFNVQEFTDDGITLVGGRLYTYAHGTTNLKVAYTDPAGTIPQTYTADGTGGQYIALNVRGELPAPLYLADAPYDITLRRADGTTVWTRRADGVDNKNNALIAQMAGPAGATLIGFGDERLDQALKKTVSSVSSIAALAALDVTIATKVLVTGYYKDGDGGGGNYVFDPTYTSAVDNGGTIITAAGGAWVRMNDGPVNQYVFGAVGDGVADDTERLQKWLTWATASGIGKQYGIHGKTGRHKIVEPGLKVVVADALPRFTSDGPTNFVLTGTALTMIDFSASGGSGQTSQAEWEGVGISPTAKQPLSIGLSVRGLCSVRFKNWQFFRASTACLMHNDKAGSFTELVVLDNPYFDTTVDCFVRYRKTLGDASFRSSGVVNGKGNIGQGCTPFVVEPEAVAYFGACDITLWNYSTNCTFITNQSTQQIWIGNITVEPLRLSGAPAQENNKITLASGSYSVFLLGRIAAWAFNSGVVFKGTLTLCREYFNTSDRGQLFLPENDSGSVATKAPGESFDVRYSPGVEPPFSPDSALLTVCVQAPGYTWRGLYAVRTGLDPNVVNAAPLYTPDLYQSTGVTFGHMTVTQGTDRNINFSNTSATPLPTGTVLTFNIQYTHALIPNL